MIAKLKLIGLGVLGLLTSILYALLQREKKERAQDQAEAEKTAREYERAGSEALIGGLKREQEKTNETIDTINRDHFS